MNIDAIKISMTKYLGKKHTFIYTSSRGLYEKFDGMLIHLYPRIFTIKTSSGSIKAFTYSDFAVKNLKII